MAKARVDRVQLRHYRSIRSYDVPLGQLTFLVGPNGSGKSNFLDALRLVSEALRTSVDQAVAIFQRPSGEVDPTLIGIEEPEVAVHPAAASVLREAIVEASRTRQIVVTSHSPELLDDPDLLPEQIVAVRAGDGVTVLGRPDPAGRTALRDRLYTAGELLRIDQLVPGSEPEQPFLQGGPPRLERDLRGVLGG